MPLLRKDVQLRFTDREPNRSTHAIYDHAAHDGTHTITHDKPLDAAHYVAVAITHNLTHHILADKKPNKEPDMRAVQRVRRCAVISL